jgi:site-specific DNA-cytosine methylase
VNGLALCAGAGGLELGLHLAEPGYRTVGFVEREARAAASLVARELGYQEGSECGMRGTHLTLCFYD